MYIFFIFFSLRSGLTFLMEPGKLGSNPFITDLKTWTWTPRQTNDNETHVHANIKKKATRHKHTRSTSKGQAQQNASASSQTPTSQDNLKYMWWNPKKEEQTCRSHRHAPQKTRNHGTRTQEAHARDKHSKMQAQVHRPIHDMPSDVHVMKPQKWKAKPCNE